MVLPLDDFDLIPSCDVAGILAKFQSWGHLKSDEISDRLIPLAQDMIEYSKLHENIVSSWRGASPKKVIEISFIHCIEDYAHATELLIQASNFIITKQHRMAVY